MMADFDEIEIADMVFGAVSAAALVGVVLALMYMIWW